MHQLLKLLASCLLLAVGIGIGIYVNYYGMLLEAIHVHVQVYRPTWRSIDCVALPGVITVCTPVCRAVAAHACNPAFSSMTAKIKINSAVDLVRLLQLERRRITLSS